MEQVTVRQLAGRIHVLLGDKLRISGATLEGRVRKAGRLLPRRIRRAAQVLVDAEKKAEDPRLIAQIDGEHVSAAYATCSKYLDRLDPIAAKSKARYALAARISLQILLIVAAALAILKWRGYL